MAQHITDQMRRFIEARRDFLLNNRPACPGSRTNPVADDIKMMPGLFIGSSCDDATPARLVEQSTPAQWMCARCRRSWTQEPVPDEPSESC